MPSPTASETVRVMIVDDHEIVRRGIAEIIDRADGLEVVAEAGGQAEALRRAELVRPDVVLVDLQLPDGTGIELMHEMRETVPGALPIVLTSFDDDEALAEALDAGARAYLLKTVHGAEISDVVRAVASGRVLLDERTVTRRRADHDDPTAELTNAERKVLDLIGDGLSNREIGERLGVAEKTVKNHITSLLAKMGLQRRTQVDGVGTGQVLGSPLRGAQDRAADGPQDGAHALAPTQDAPGGLEQLRGGLAQVLPAPAAVLQDLGQTVLDDGTDTAQGRRQRTHDRQSSPSSDVRRAGDPSGGGFAAARRRVRTR